MVAVGGIKSLPIVALLLMFTHYVPPPPVVSIRILSRIGANQRKAQFEATRIGKHFTNQMKESARLTRHEYVLPSQVASKDTTQSMAGNSSSGLILTSLVGSGSSRWEEVQVAHTKCVNFSVLYGLRKGTANG